MLREFFLWVAAFILSVGAIFARDAVNPYSIAIEEVEAVYGSEIFLPSYKSAAITQSFKDFRSMEDSRSRAETGVARAAANYEEVKRKYGGYPNQLNRLRLEYNEWRIFPLIILGATLLVSLFSRRYAVALTFASIFPVMFLIAAIDLYLPTMRRLLFCLAYLSFALLIAFIVSCIKRRLRRLRQTDIGSTPNNFPLSA
jgi:hypothetical protein